MPRCSQAGSRQLEFVAHPHLMGCSMMGPFMSSISKGMPSAGSGVKMSLQQVGTPSV